jgi:methyl-galactoside transport system ATP-binding protein
MEQLEYLLEMRNMSKSFPGVKALDNVNLLVRPGSVHALVGENGAGKSTLMKCLFGIYHQNEGRILLHGKEVFIQTPHNALMNGVAMVHQELEQVHERNVMDNIWLGRYPKSFLTVNEKKMYLDTSVIFKSLDIQIDPKEKLKNLSVSQRQMVDIAKSFSYNSNIFVMDEPTSSLTETEVEHLFRIIKTLKEKGSSIIYISHKLSEIFNVADEVTILRDGKWVETAKVNNITTEKLISLMVGRTLDNLYPPKENIPGKTILKIDGLSEKAKNSIKDIAFDLKEGEILGIAGLMGSRRTELVETIFGIREKICGEIYLEGKLINNKNSEYAIKNGFALCTEERRFNGIFPGLSVSFNSTIANIKKYSNRIGALNNKKIALDTKWVIESKSSDTVAFRGKSTKSDHWKMVAAKFKNTAYG